MLKNVDKSINNQFQLIIINSECELQFLCCFFDLKLLWNELLQKSEVNWYKGLNELVKIKSYKIQ